MKLSDFDYILPEELIATHPASPRDSSRLLVLDKVGGEIEHRRFFDVIDYLNPGDVLVLNNSRVIPARLLGEKKGTGGRMEVFLHKIVNDGEWECLLGGRGARVGMEIIFPGSNLLARIVRDNEDGTWIISFNLCGADFSRALESIGHVPLPPYIEKKRGGGDEDLDRSDYQTVYAHQEKNGSVAAPTAGLHFTPELLDRIREKGIRIEYITLHVGMGTFAPVKTDDVLHHKMHAERVEIDAKTIERLFAAKKAGHRIITVGTTSTRAVEAMGKEFSISNDQFSIQDSEPVNENWKFKIENYSMDVDIFIYPGYKFLLVDGMITNFHLPKSTLLMLVSALASQDMIRHAYD